MVQQNNSSSNKANLTNFKKFQPNLYNSNPQDLRRHRYPPVQTRRSPSNPFPFGRTFTTQFTQQTQPSTQQTQPPNKPIQQIYFPTRPTQQTLSSTQSTQQTLLPTRSIQPTLLPAQSIQQVQPPAQSPLKTPRPLSASQTQILKILQLKSVQLFLTIIPALVFLAGLILVFLAFFKSDSSDEQKKNMKIIGFILLPVGLLPALFAAYCFFIRNYHS